MPARLEIQPGSRFGRYTVLREVERLHASRGFLCRCECGVEKIVDLRSLRKGHTVSCGCYKRQRSTRHGLHGTRLYFTWKNMKSRCLNPKHPEYGRYGGRGIAVCQEWMRFEPFYKWAIANGYRDDLTIERIDVNGHYEPKNCTWIPPADQARNTRKTQRVWLNGRGMTLGQWAQTAGMTYSTLRRRLYAGMSLEEALIAPAHRGRRWPEVSPR